MTMSGLCITKKKKKSYQDSSEQNSSYVQALIGAQKGSIQAMS